LIEGKKLDLPGLSRGNGTWKDYVFGIKSSLFYLQLLAENLIILCTGNTKTGSPGAQPAGIGLKFRRF